MVCCREGGILCRPVEHKYIYVDINCAGTQRDGMIDEGNRVP